jgi:type-IV secretion system protein TraC
MLMKLTNSKLLKNRSENFPESSLARELPYWDFSDSEEGAPWLSLLDGTLVGGLKLSGISTETRDAEEINQFTLGLRALLNSLSDGTELQIILESNSDFAACVRDHETYSGTNPLIDWLSKGRSEKLWEEIKTGQLRKSSLYLFIYERPVRSQSGLLSFFQKPSSFQSVKVATHQKRLRELEQKVSAVRGMLERAGAANLLLSSEEIRSLIYRFLNPTRSKNQGTPKTNNEHRRQEFTAAEAQVMPELYVTSPREQLVFGDVIQSERAFKLDGLHHRVITLKTLPEITHSALVSKFTDLPIHYLLSIQIKVPEQSKEIALIQSRRRMAHSMNGSNGGRASDLESEAKLISTEELLREILNTGQKIFSFQFAVLIQDKNSDELDRKTNLVLSRVRALSGAEALAETVANFKVYKTILPAGNTTMVRPKRIKADNLADFLPLYEPYAGSEKAVCLFKNRQSGLVKYDPFDSNLPNFNSLVTGASGSGKSFLSNCILLQGLSQNPKVFIIDIGGSYRKLCSFMGGQYIEVSPPVGKEIGTTINPFVLPNGEDGPSPQKIKFLLSLLETMLTENELDKLPKLSKSLLEEVIIKTYQESGSTPTLTSFNRTLLASNEAELKSFSKMLYPWTGSRPYGRLLDGPGTLALESDFVVFDLKSLSSFPDLQSVMVLMITDYILGKAEHTPGRKKQIVMDECWALLKSQSAGQFMEYCARTLRKTGSGIRFITQGFEEILQSPVGPAILNNTATKLVLKQKRIELAKEALKLNEKEADLIMSLQQSKGNYSEAFLIANEDRAVIRITPTPLEYWLATSDASDNALLAQAGERFREKSLPELIHHLATHYPYGAQGAMELKAEAT